MEVVQYEYLLKVEIHTRQTSILFNVGGGGREAATINKILFCSPGRGKGYIRVSVRFPQGCGGRWGRGNPPEFLDNILR
jgi:hypothetical protein